MSTKPGFVLKRTQQLLLSDDVENQLNALALYNTNRQNNKDEEGFSSCYCGKAKACHCPDPTLEEFKEALFNYKISEEQL
jgi:hypothetical protein